MKQLSLFMLCFVVPFVASAEPGNKATVREILDRAIQPISTLRPLTERELRAKSKGHYLTPMVRATDQCAPHYDIAGTVTCSAPMSYYQGIYQIVSNGIITDIRGRITTQLFYKDRLGGLFSSYPKARSAVEVAFYDDGDELPVRLR